jgi:hypothetical protein
MNLVEKGTFFFLSKHISLPVFIIGNLINCCLDYIFPILWFTSTFTVFTEPQHPKETRSGGREDDDEILKSNHTRIFTGSISNFPRWYLLPSQFLFPHLPRSSHLCFQGSEFLDTNWYIDPSFSKTSL